MKGDDVKQAKQTEVDGLIKRQIWNIVKREDVSKNSNIVRGRFVLTLKLFFTPHETAKLRYISKGYANDLKDLLVHDTNALRPTSIRINLSIAAVISFRLFSHDVK